MLPVMFLHLLHASASDERAVWRTAVSLDLKSTASLVELTCSSVIRMSVQNKTKSVRLLPAT